MTDFRKELAQNANKLATPGKGILAADESTGTIGKKFTSVGIDNTESNRQAYRDLMFHTPGLEQHISGVILYSETAKQNDLSGKKFVQVLKEKDILCGIKVDQGLKNIPGTKDETATHGLDTLDAMAKEFYQIGCRFAKWRAVLKISADGCPTDQAIQENAWGLARYGAICQANGLVPIIEPEILSDGDHSIETCQKVSERVLAAVVKALQENNIFWEGCLLKPNMVTQGSNHPVKASPAEVAFRTVTALSRTIPPALVGVFFLSGGQSEEDASLNLNAMNKLQGVRRPWFLTFSYGRALQNSCVKAWAGKQENVKSAQQALLQRCKANSEAQLGKYEGSKDGAGQESLFVHDYKY
ncbi:hypothetical protein IMG5_006010 [Ichthyophthirius multifiliis]|uniref:Fructose-bisphosphate aldolase n=1 Tax=Ichthyophthirius multifiliis TaxID=5932 RepID=G0QJK1_ICHMU|nr:hypothetical protein IMG5_006010 [Ichthyophthirius multifiliis]EGR34602.1 hypothetical protein IMG5_006010 [Ichthyophthirius multifiliis]|eukprot:XP_004039906.1 hypothetical protein IMG5_006010 [Ichthyophthirius multifiliis]